MKIKMLLATLGAAFALSACSSLHDVNTSWCDPEPEPTPIPTPTPVVQPERVSLAADALFRFDKFKTEDLLPQGKQTLDELAHKLNTGYATVERIDLTGHTDRLGTEQYNYTLGLNRAKTVREYLQNRGVNAAMTVRTAGESEPVTTGCIGNKATTALTNCLQPDRRVVVDIWGIRKGNGGIGQ